MSELFTLPLAWYHWAVFGIVLMASELLIPAFVLVWFGLGGCLAAILLALFPGLSVVTQIMIWIAASLIFVLLWFKLFKSALHKSNAGRSSSGIVGEAGLLTREVDIFHRGRVRFQQPLAGSDEWECIADHSIAMGERVKVVSVEGHILKITTLH